jgi:alginate O-acetyltransferase complex protein AlgI
MLFTEPRFLVFFLVVFGVHWTLRANGVRKAWLLLASYAFYAAWDARFLSLIVASTLIDYVAALRMQRPGARRGRWLFLSVGANLSMLGFFKYFDFFVGSAAELLTWLGLPTSDATLGLILPVGISFYTFQTMSYSLDVYRRRMEPTRNLLDVATFVAFFPQLVAGPIVRAAEFLPQLREPRRLGGVDVRGALVLFLVGFFKKTCVSDNLAPAVDIYFAQPWEFDAVTAWAAVLAYAVQIYCDFSGYSDMAIACAALLGYRLVLNFDYPYVSRSVTEFWRRWHISLSSWLRDYLYIPLGGGRGSALCVGRNLMITMLLGGLWHGAAWNFVIWGGLHGLALIVHRIWRRLPERALVRRAVALVSLPLTLVFVCACWIFFRAQTLDAALTITRAFLLFESPGEHAVGRALFWILPALALLHVASARGALIGWWRRIPAPAFGAAYALLWGLALPLVSIRFTPFIYFQF